MESAGTKWPAGGAHSHVPPPPSERTKAAGDRQTDQTDRHAATRLQPSARARPPPPQPRQAALASPLPVGGGLHRSGEGTRSQRPGLAPPPQASGAAELRPTQNGCAGPGRREPEPSMEGGIARRLPLLSRRDRSPPNAGGKRQPAPPGYGAAGGVSGSCR